jgi:hypothetical protein
MSPSTRDFTKRIAWQHCQADQREYCAHGFQTATKGSDQFYQQPVNQQPNHLVHEELQDVSHNRAGHTQTRTQQAAPRSGRKNTGHTRQTKTCSELCKALLSSHLTPAERTDAACRMENQKKHCSNAVSSRAQRHTRLSQERIHPSPVQRWGVRRSSGGDNGPWSEAQTARSDAGRRQASSACPIPGVWDTSH